MATVLIIDDDDAFRAALASTLEAAGHVVAMASDGFEGARFCRTSPPQVVMLDMIMPYGGLETLRVLHSQFPAISVIAMSGSEVRRLEIAKSLGAVAALHKPFSPIQLTSAMAVALQPPAPSAPPVPPKT